MSNDKESAAARVWTLPLNTLIINSDLERPGGVVVIEKSAYDKLAGELEQLRKRYDMRIDERDKFKGLLASASESIVSNGKAYSEQLATLTAELEQMRARNSELIEMALAHDGRASKNLQEANELRKERDRYWNALTRIVNEKWILLRKDLDRLLDIARSALNCKSESK